MLVLHVTEQAAWQSALEQGIYRGDTLESQGFIHCCLPNQLEGVLKEWFAGKRDLVVLEIDSRVLDSPLRFENPSDCDEKFPHIYGPINLDAIRSHDAVNHLNREET